MSNNTAEKKQASSSSSSSSSGPAGEEQKTTGPPKGILRDYFESFVVTLIMALFGMTFVLQAVTVPTASMENTILVGDYLLVNKFIFSPGDTLPFLPQREIKRGDIIVFKYPGNSRHPERDRTGHSTPLRKYEINYVKRVVGLPGESIEFRNNQLFINGQLLPEYRMQGDHPTRRNSRQQNSEAPLTTAAIEEKQPDQPYSVYYGQHSIDNAKKGAPEDRDFEYAAPGEPFTIPDDSYFVMGDNRDNSEDSRFWGPVKRDLIIGRAMFVYWSCDQTESESMSNCITHPRFDRIFKFIK